MNVNTPGSSNQNSPRNNNDISHSLTQGNTAFKRREIRVGDRGVNLVNLFSFGYGNTGYYIMKYLFSSDIRNLREVCTDMCSRLFQKGIVITPTKLGSINQYVCPRLYARVQHSNLGAFPPMPVDALVQNVNDLRTILKDARFFVRGIVFKGELKDLKEMCKSLPQAIDAIEIGIEIPSSERINLSQYRQLKIVKVKNRYISNFVLPEGVTVLYDLSKQMPVSIEQPADSQIVRNPVKAVIIASDNELFNQVIKVANDSAKQESILLIVPDINIKDKRGLTVLHYACISGDAGLVKILIEKFKASIDETNLDGQTALSLAINNGYKNIEKYLMESNHRRADIRTLCDMYQSIVKFQQQECSLLESINCVSKLASGLKLSYNYKDHETIRNKYGYIQGCNYNIIYINNAKLGRIYFEHLYRVHIIIKAELS